MAKRRYAVGPNGRLKRAERLFKNFNGRPPRHLDTVRLPAYKQLVRIGPCVAIAYHADDGKDYIHKFKRSARPLLAVSDDGKHLVLIGGRYHFTGRGIVDR